MTDEMSKDQRIAELEAEVALLRGVRDGANSRTLRMYERATAAEATLAKVAALPRHMVAAWVVGQREGEERLTSVYAIRADEVDAVLASAGRPATSDGDANDRLFRAEGFYRITTVPMVASSATDEDGAL